MAAVPPAVPTWIHCKTYLVVGASCGRRGAFSGTVVAPTERSSVAVGPMSMKLGGKPIHIGGGAEAANASGGVCGENAAEADDAAADPVGGCAAEAASGTMKATEPRGRGMAFVGGPEGGVAAEGCGFVAGGDRKSVV